MGAGAAWAIKSDGSYEKILDTETVALCGGSDFGVVSFVPIVGDVDDFINETNCLGALWSESDDTVGIILHGTLAGISGVFIVVDVVTFGLGSVVSSAVKLGAKAAFKAVQRGGKVLLKRGSQAVADSGDNLAKSGLGFLRRRSSSPGAGEVCYLVPNCFVDGTVVLTSEGLRPIEEIQRGDYVWSRHGQTGEESWQPVVRTFERESSSVLELELVDKEREILETIGVTGEHPFWVEGRGWTAAAELVEGDKVYTVAGGWLRVGSSTWVQGRRVVYNFEVERSHTYFVGESGAWVHNTDCGPNITRWADGPGGAGRSFAANDFGLGNSFSVAERIGGQLLDPRLGTLTGKIAPHALEGLANNPAARRFLDASTGHINIIQDLDGVLLRITTPRDMFRIISVGRVRANSVANGIARGRFLPLQ